MLPVTPTLAVPLPAWLPRPALWEPSQSRTMFNGLTCSNGTWAWNMSFRVMSFSPLLTSEARALTLQSSTTSTSYRCSPLPKIPFLLPARPLPRTTARTPLLRMRSISRSIRTRAYRHRPSSAAAKPSLARQCRISSLHATTALPTTTENSRAMARSPASRTRQTPFTIPSSSRPGERSAISPSAQVIPSATPSITPRIVPMRFSSIQLTPASAAQVPTSTSGTLSLSATYMLSPSSSSQGSLTHSSAVGKPPALLPLCRAPRSRSQTVAPTPTTPAWPVGSAAPCSPSRTLSAIPIVSLRPSGRLMPPQAYSVFLTTIQMPTRYQSVSQSETRDATLCGSPAA